MQLDDKIEINDCCQFIEVNQFGTSILKIFFQLMSIIQFIALKIKQKPANQYLQQQPITFYPRIIQLKKHKQINITNNQSAKDAIQNLTKQINQLENQHNKQSNQTKSFIQKIKQGHIRANQIESSQSQTILSETVDILCQRSQSINNFVALMQASQNIHRQCGTQYFSRVKDRFQQDQNQQIERATNKLKRILQKFMIEEKQKKIKSLVHSQIQTMPIQIQNQQDYRRKIRKLSDMVKKYKQDCQFYQERCKTLQTDIQNKIIYYQNSLTIYRSQKLQYEQNLKILAQKALNTKQSKRNSKKQIQKVNEEQDIQIFQNKLKSRFNRLKNVSKIKIKQSFTNQLCQIQSNILNIVIQPHKVTQSKKQINYINYINQIYKKQPSLNKISQKFIKSKNKQITSSSVIMNESLIKVSKTSQKNLASTDSKYKVPQKSHQNRSSLLSKNLIQPKPSLIKKQSTKSSNMNLKISKNKLNISQNQYNVNNQTIQIDKQIQSIKSHSLSQSHPQKYIQHIIQKSQQNSIIATQSIGFDFIQKDLQTIFLGKNNAINYQKLTISLESQSKKFYFSGIKVPISSIKAVRKPLQKLNLLNIKQQEKNQEKKQQNIKEEIFMKMLKKLLNTIKKNKNNQIKLTAFLRYPYTFTKILHTQSWESFSKQISPLDFGQFKRLMNRIISLHSNCEQLPCKHIEYLYKKFK